MSKEKIPIEKWFDPQNPEHLKAYLELQSSGRWPENFIPENVVMVHGWGLLLLSKMADCWLSFKLGYLMQEED